MMYGGVSLAIYMNGIAQELLSLVRSTAVEDRLKPDSVMLTDLKGTEAVYRELALLLSEEGDGAVHVQFVIDIISGTSAGGINGVFLAKALAARKDMLSLKRVWIEEGDFQRLLNDQALPDLDLPQQVPPRSLLSGERMYLLLFDAFAEMDENSGQSYVDELNLWVTTTDLLGMVVPLRLADRVVFERKYKQAFNLRYSTDLGRNDFERKNTPFLAFAARCTSSFPVAFEPMQLASIQGLLRFSKKFEQGKYESNPDIWEGFFGSDARVKGSERFFADGGYLDNRPFDHAIGGLTQQSSRVLSERKLLYIEPSPEHPEREHKGENRKGKLIQPDAIENAWDGLAGIPGKQPIRDNLVRIQERNRLIRKVNRVIGAISAAIEDSPLTREQTVGESPDAQRAARSGAWAEAQQRVGYRAYTVLNVYSVTDDLAVRIARIYKLDETSDYVFAIRCLVKVWREKRYANAESQFLLDFDISYRMRRYQFVKSQLELLGRLDKEALERLRRTGIAAPADDTEAREFRKEITAMRGVFDQSFRKIRIASGLALDAPEIRSKIGDLNIAEADLNKILGVKPVTGEDTNWAPLPVIDDSDYDKRATELLTEKRDATLKELQLAIKGAYSGAIREARQNVEAAIQGGTDDSPVRQKVLRLARLYFYGFQEFDAAIFPITYGTDIGELDPVDVMRVSPEDATAIVDEVASGRHKLAGTAFGAFGAFLERVWRTNDILWGRLDGAERIIRTLARPGQDVDGLICRAHDIIIEEELKPANRAEICQMLVDALLRTDAGAKSNEQRANMLATIEQCVEAAKGAADINPKLVAVLQRALTPEQIRCCLANFEISREPNRKETLDSVARSARIIGRMLADMARKRPALKKPGTILIQAGSVLWGMVEVSVPGSIWGAFFNYWFGLLTLFSVVMIVGGTVLSPPVQTLGFRLLALTLAAKLAVSTLHRFIQGDRRWWRILEAIFIFLVVALLVLGFVELHDIMLKLDGPMESARTWIAKLLHGAVSGQ